MGLMGFEFVEVASPTPGTLEPVFEIALFKASPSGEQASASPSLTGAWRAPRRVARRS